MAPAQILDISAQQTNDKYNHKKFQGKRNYSHKKFGTRSALKATESKTLPEEVPSQTISQNLNTPANNTKKSTAILFRPYALPDKTPRKRKHEEIKSEEDEETPMEAKRFAYPNIPTPSPSPPNPVPNPFNTPFFTATTPLMPNPYYRLQHYQFNPQIFALILQKQRAALCMGEILKRQANLNLYNLMGQ